MDFSKDELEEVLKIFGQESSEIIRDMETNINLLKEDPNNKELAIRLFRSAHSLKGSARMLGYMKIQEVAHKTEDVLGCLKENKIEANEKVLDVILNAIGYISFLISKTVENKKEYFSSDTDKYIKELENIVGEEKKLSEEIVPKDNEVILLIEKNSNNILNFKNGENSNVLGDLRIISDKITNSKIKEGYEKLLKLLSLENAITFQDSIFKLIKEVLSESIEVIKNNDKNREELFLRKIFIIEQMVNAGTELVAKPKEKQDKHSNVLTKTWFNELDNETIKTLRVDSSKLDTLVNIMEDLIMTKIKIASDLEYSRKFQVKLEEWYRNWHKIGHYIKYYDRKYLTGANLKLDLESVVSYNKQLLNLYNSHSESFYTAINRFQEIYKHLQENETKLSATVNELENNVKSLRVLPFASIFYIFPRMVHSLAQEQGKKINFTVEGSEVIADKKIVEEIKMPLMHIIRNSVAHGIELPEVREKLGKNPKGRVSVHASYQDNKIIIDVRDDGSGLDIKKIKHTALKKGIITKEEEEKLTEDEVINLIFYPGFSTDENVSELSGRGFGMDIVRNKITCLNGEINIYTRLDKGTLVRIKLPVAMATINAFIVQESDQLFAIESSFIKNVIRIKPEEIFKQDDRNNFLYKEEIIPVFTLSQILGYENTPKTSNKHIVVILEEDEKKIGVIVDKLIDDQEILQKQLAKPLEKVKNISGVANISTGEICLILNVSDIVNTVMPQNILGDILTVNQNTTIQDNSKYSILVLDDSKTTRIMQKNILTNNGFKVHSADSAKEALKILDEENIDLVITDYEMPDINGIEFCKLLRADIRFGQLPVIVLTSYDTSKIIEKFDEYDINKYLVKSKFDQTFFIDTISNILKQRDLERDED